MRGDKRRWIYAGLGVPPGVAVVGPPRTRLALPGRRILLAGGKVANGIATALGRLARDAKVPLVVDARPGLTAAQWLQNGSIAARVREIRPRVVLLGLEPHRALDEHVRECGVLPLWLATTPHENNGLCAVHPPLVDGRMATSASGYAAWAAAVWSSIN